MIENMIEVRLNTDYLKNKKNLDVLAEKVVYTGLIDAYFDYMLEPLEYRSVCFEVEHLNIDNFQGNAAVNYTDCDTPYTRIIEHKWFEFGKDDEGNDIPTTKQLTDKEANMIFGRLAEYKYYYIDSVIVYALNRTFSFQILLTNIQI
ncbi:hypothetical protein C815_00639 [Firmicutes bacterium M10-2]|nr:hypothetical protein C815_00639 [Firmicutes bacterium M10-2]